MTRLSRVTAIGLVLVLSGSLVYAIRRAVPVRPENTYAALEKASDQVVIASWIESRETETTVDLSKEHKIEADAVAVVSTFRVKKVLKGPERNTIEVQHFRFKRIRNPAMESPPHFLSIRKKAVQATVNMDTVITFERPDYLLYLKKKADNLYEPSSGWYYATHSVFEVCEPFPDYTGEGT